MRGLPEDHPDVVSEFDQITTSVASEKAQEGSIFTELKHNTRRILLGCFMQIAQQWTGTNAIVCNQNVDNTIQLMPIIELLWPIDFFNSRS